MVVNGAKYCSKNYSTINCQHQELIVLNDYLSLIKFTERFIAPKNKRPNYIFETNSLTNGRLHEEEEITCSG